MVGAAWLMTQLTSSPFMVGLVQAAIMLPVFLVILPAGALADMVDRRRFLLVNSGVDGCGCRFARHTDAARLRHALAVGAVYISAGLGRRRQ